MNQAERAVVWLSAVPYMVPRVRDELVAHFGSEEALYHAAKSRKALEAAGVSSALCEKLHTTADEVYIDSVLEKVRAAGVGMIFTDDIEYPARLEQIYDPPGVLYCMGNASLLSAKRAVTVVGTRRATDYGRTAAYNLCKSIAAQGVTVVSGLAMGIDRSAHLGALDAGGSTVAVLAGSPDVPAPAMNTDVYRRILAEGGLIVSEKPPGTPVDKGDFPIRNRLMSALGEGVLVVEATENSGTMHTVNSAHEQGRTVMAVPGNIDSMMSAGTNRMIRDGAAPILCSRDIMEEMGWGELALTPAVTGAEPEEDPRLKMDRQSRLVYDYLLEHGETEGEYLFEQLRLPAGSMNSLLTIMEIRGIIKKFPGNRFRVNTIR